MHHISYYKQRIQSHNATLNLLKNKLAKLSTLRLLLFISICIEIYFFYTEWKIALALAVILFAAFLYVVSIYTNIKNQKKTIEILIDDYTTELNIADGKFTNRPDGSAYKNPSHAFSHDIDLFGKGSFFQYSNRTATHEGETKLANILTENSTDNIEEKQAAIQELATKTDWMFEFAATAKTIKTDIKTTAILQWAANYKPFVPQFAKWIPYVFGAISISIFALSYLGLLPVNITMYWLFAGLAVTGKYLKKINTLSEQTSKLRDLFKQYSLLLDKIETETFTTAILNQLQQDIQEGDEKASAIFKSLSKKMDAFDNRNNLIIAVFGNGYFLLDLKNAFQIEQWLIAYNSKLSTWFDTISQFDAFNTLGTFTFNHPEYTFPKITNADTIIAAKQLSHPLLKKEKRIANDIHISNEAFFIITGANMAGKSTFLRTVSLHIVMANIGLPVCATESIYKPIPLITSMRTSDSLTDDSSYFFAELTRLKHIVDTIQNQPHFIILDEILKGTNSTDKALGSKKFVERLVNAKATGIIATHDLSLCEIENELSQVKNYYFDAEIENDELHFDYTFKKGICKNMNASFLLRKMEII